MSQLFIISNITETATNIIAVAWKRKHAYIDPSLNGNNHRFTTDFRRFSFWARFTLGSAWLIIIRVINLVSSWPMSQSRDMDILSLAMSLFIITLRDSLWLSYKIYDKRDTAQKSLIHLAMTSIVYVGLLWINLICLLWLNIDSYVGVHLSLLYDLTLSILANSLICKILWPGNRACSVVNRSMPGSIGPIKFVCGT